MQYEPIKRSLGKLISGRLLARRLYYRLLDILLLRTWHVRKELREIRSLLPENSKILDAGCGPGQYSWRLCRMNSTWHVTGVDIDPSVIEDCRKFFEKAGLGERTAFRTADLAELREADSYNLILSVDVMEHISDDEKVFRNFFESLKEGGRLVISTPSDRGGSDAHDEGDKSFIDEHVRNGYGAAEIRDKLARAGFGSIETRYTYGPAGNISWRLSMKYPVKMLNISYIFFIILPFYYLVTLPVSLVLNFFDLKMTRKTGTGLLVTAAKQIT